MTIVNILSGIIREGAFFTGNPNQIRTQFINPNRQFFSGRFYKVQSADPIQLSSLVLRWLPQLTIFTRDESALWNFQLFIDNVSVFFWEGTYYAATNPDVDMLTGWSFEEGFQELSIIAPVGDFEFRVEFYLESNFVVHEGAGNNSTFLLFEIYGEVDDTDVCCLADCGCECPE